MLNDDSRAVTVAVEFRRGRNSSPQSGLSSRSGLPSQGGMQSVSDMLSSAESLAELDSLCRSAGIFPLAALTAKRDSPHPATFIGGGKAEELRALADGVSADAAVFAHDLSPGQQRNLERACGCKVLDRSRLILDIFARRAQSGEGKMQVELARNRYALSRLAGGWTHLERQRGGIGLRGGPGEKQLEIDRRLINRRIKNLERRLAAMQARNTQAQKRRRQSGTTTASLVGYTNAGKSTLFNQLAGEKKPARNRLFDTLDSTARRANVGGGAQVVVADTVGFIRNLPHSLIAGFRATLAEAAAADCLLIVADASSPSCNRELAVVEETLAQIGAGDSPRIIVWNKIDRAGISPSLERDNCGRISAVRLSAVTGEGIPLLRRSLLEISKRFGNSADDFNSSLN